MSRTIHASDQDTVERDTTVDTTEVPTREAPTCESDPPPRRTRAGLTWLAVGAALATSVGFAVVVLTSGGNSGDRPAITPAAVAGSDQHLYNQANDIANRTLDVTGSDQHLHNQASAGVTEAPAIGSAPTVETPTCSIWSVPTLEVAPVAQSNLTEGVPYVAVCTDDADEETTFMFLYGRDNHTPARR